MKINKINLSVFALLLSIEIYIALYSKQIFVRQVLGDFLVVLLIYYFFKSFLALKPIYVALFALFFSFSVEFLQYIDIISILNINNNPITNLILGTTYSIYDLLAYTLGFFTIIFIEKLRKFLIS